MTSSPRLKAWGGFNNEEIAKRLVDPAAEKPNPNTDWLDLQAQALKQAEEIVLALIPTKYRTPAKTI